MERLPHYVPKNRNFIRNDRQEHALAGAIEQLQPHTFTRGLLAGGSIGDITLTSSALIAIILIETTEFTNTYLIIATGEIKNSGQETQQVSEPGETPVLYEIREWGEDHVEVEGIGADITLPIPAENVECFSLNPDGSDHSNVEPEPLGAQCRLHLLPTYETLWYKLVITT